MYVQLIDNTVEEEEEISGVADCFLFNTFPTINISLAWLGRNVSLMYV